MTDDPTDARETSTAPVVFVGDPITAMGYRLAGAEPLTPPVERTLSSLDQAAARGARVVLLSAEYAARLAPDELARLLAAETPLLLVVPDARDRGPRYDVAEDARLVLGSEL